MQSDAYWLQRLLVVGGTLAINVLALTAGTYVSPADAPSEVVASESYEVPSRYLPAAGECRIWFPGEAPEAQPAPSNCEMLAAVPSGAWLLEGPFLADDE